jgi:hypothetical protein
MRQLCREHGCAQAASALTPVLFGAAERVGLMLERLCARSCPIHEDDDGDVLRVGHQPRPHDVLPAL